MWKDQRLDQCNPLQRTQLVERRTARGQDDEVHRVLGATCSLCAPRRDPACSGGGGLSERKNVRHKPAEGKGREGVRQKWALRRLFLYFYSFSAIQEDLFYGGGLHCAYPSLDDCCAGKCQYPRDYADSVGALCKGALAFQRTSVLQKA